MNLHRYLTLVTLGLLGSVALAAPTASDTEVVANRTRHSVQVIAVQEEFLVKLELAPILGRRFAASDFERNAPPVAILSNAFWKKALGGGPAVIGTKIKVGSVDHTVIGVLPESKKLPAGVQLWVASARNP